VVSSPSYCSRFLSTLFRKFLCGPAANSRDGKAGKAPNYRVFHSLVTPLDPPGCRKRLPLESFRGQHDPFVTLFPEFSFSKQLSFSLGVALDTRVSPWFLSPYCGGVAPCRSPRKNPFVSFFPSPGELLLEHFLSSRSRFLRDPLLLPATSRLGTSSF